jgi:ABC-type nitrate/sulfonate/bicarbonate transport system permease component
MNGAVDIAAQSERARIRSERRQRQIMVAAGLIIFLSAWEIAGRLTNPLFFAPASEVAREFVNALLDPRARLLNGLLETLGVLVPGFLIACVLGVALGVLMGRSELAYHILDPHVTILYNTPRVALIPILLLWMGVGDLLKIVIVVLAAIFPVSVNTMVGVRDVSAQFTEPARSLQATERQLLWKVILPATFPFIIAGIKLALGRALTTVIVAEFFVSVSGLGGVLQAASSSYQMARMFAPVIILAAMGIALDGALTYFERSVLRRYRS